MPMQSKAAGGFQGTVPCLRWTDHAHTRRRRGTVIPHFLSHCCWPMPTTTSNAIFPHTTNVHDKQSEHQIISESKADRIISLLSHEIAQQSQIWMFYFQRELSIFRFPSRQ